MRRLVALLGEQCDLAARLAFERALGPDHPRGESVRYELVHALLSRHGRTNQSPDSPDFAHA